VARPLAYSEIRAILAKLTGANIVLVGGQALNFWADYYLPNVKELAAGWPYTSKDIDFCGTRHAVVDCAKRLGGRAVLPDDFDGVNAGAVLYLDSADGEQRRIDFITAPYGLSAEDVQQTAIPVDVTDEHGQPTGVTFTVMNPERCMESRVANVIGLGARSDHSMKQLRASVFCAREFLRELLAAGHHRAVLNLNERIFEFCLNNLHGRVAAAQTGIDPFDAVLCSPELPEKFNAIRCPQMQRRLSERRRTMR